MYVLRYGCLNIATLQTQHNSGLFPFWPITQKESPPPIVISGWRLQIDWIALMRQHSIRYHNDLAKL